MDTQFFTELGLDWNILSLYPPPPTFEQNWIVQRAMIVEHFFLSDLVNFFCAHTKRLNDLLQLIYSCVPPNVSCYCFLYMYFIGSTEAP